MRGCGERRAGAAGAASRRSLEAALPIAFLSDRLAPATCQMDMLVGGGWGGGWRGWGGWEGGHRSREGC